MSTRPAVATYRYLPVAGKTQVTTWTRLSSSTKWKGTSHNSILVIVDRLTKLVHCKPVQITIDVPALAAGYMPSNSTALTTHTFSMKTSNWKLMTACLVWACDIANPFPPNLWGYVHGFSCWFNLWVGYVWQISFHRTIEVVCINLTINRKVW